MRIVVDTDPKADQTWRKVKSVHLDGELLTACVAADDEEGWVKVHRLDPEDPTRALHDGVNWLYDERRGKVVITLKDTSRDWDRDRRASGARVQVGREPATGDILVQVFSVVRPGAIKQMRLERAHLPAGLEAIAQKCGIVAGYAAELLGDQFGDTVDPSEAARAVVSAASDMLLAEQKGSVVLLADQAAG